MSEFKPCPFCGGKKIFQFIYPYRRKPGLRGCYVRCEKCNACTGNYETIEEAKDAWNMRKEKNNE